MELGGPEDCYLSDSQEAEDSEGIPPGHPGHLLSPQEGAASGEAVKTSFSDTHQAPVVVEVVECPALCVELPGEHRPHHGVEALTGGGGQLPCVLIGQAGSTSSL